MTEEKISKETKDEALKIARGTQKPGQTKEQTKLIAHGIEKGIADYKKQQKVKARERDKLRKKELKTKEQKNLLVSIDVPNNAVSGTYIYNVDITSHPSYPPSKMYIKVP